MRINKKVYNYIDYELTNYKSYEKKIEAIRQDIISSSPPPADGQPKGNNKSDPTLDKVIRLSTPMAIYKMECNKECIENALKKLDADHKRFFEMNYKETDANNKIKVCYDFPVSERTYYRMKGKIIEYVGKEMGLI